MLTLVSYVPKKIRMSYSLNRTQYERCGSANEKATDNPRLQFYKVRCRYVGLEQGECKSYFFINFVNVNHLKHVWYTYILYMYVFS